VNAGLREADPAPTAAAAAGAPSTEPVPGRSPDLDRLSTALEVACPTLTDRVPDLQTQIGECYRGCRENADAFVTAHRARALAADPSAGQLGLATALRDAVLTAARDGAMLAGEREAAVLANRVETELRPAVDADVSIAVAWDEAVADRLARLVDRILHRTQWAVAERLRLATVGGGDPAARYEDLAGAHARTLAVCALLAAARCGSQLVASECDLVAAKRWVRLRRAPCRAHGRVHEITVPAAGSFGAPASADRAQSAFVVGDHVPFSCSCLQRAVLGRFPTDDPRAVAAHDGVSVAVGDDPVEPLSAREREVYRRHADAGESFADMLGRFEATRSVRGGARELGVAKKTLYRWFDAYLDGFDRYSGR